MLRGMYTSISAMVNLQSSQTLITNNIANVNTTEKELEKQEEEEKQVNSELSMLKGQIILLEKNNEKITEEIEQDNKAIKEESNKNKQQIIEKYKDKNINDLLYNKDFI